MKIFLIVTALAALILTVIPVRAHDFWMAPEAYQLDTDQSSRVRFLVGHGADLTGWGLSRDRIVSLVYIGPGDTDQPTAIPFLENDIQTSTDLKGEGTHMIALESRPVVIKLNAEAFNAHIMEEGLTPAIENRRTNGLMKDSVSERFSRRAKALIQLGDAFSGFVIRPIGHSLEIVPERNPYALGPNEPLTVRVLYHGRPLAGATIDLESLVHGQIKAASHVTDMDGNAVFRFPKKGAWKLHTVWTQVLTNDPSADFETVFSSLTFGYDAR